MKIAVNTTVLERNSLDAISIFVQEIFKRITQQNPQYQFIFIFDKAYDEAFVFSKNITPIIIKSSSQNSLAKKYWYDIKLPFALKKHKPDVLIQTSNFCSLTTSILQLLILQNTARSSAKKSIQKAKKIATTSQFLKNNIVEKYKVDANKIDVVYSAAQPIFKPLSFDEMLQTKDGYADGREYFLLRNNDNLMNVLKAFSLFKKWQHSNMKLLVVGDLAEQKGIIIKLKTYKYRDDVVLLDSISVDTLAKLTASAYCVLYPSFFEGFGLPIIEAMQSCVPVITSNTSSMKEVGGDIALYANPNSSDEIAEQMQLIYKDEILRSKLIKDGLQQATKFSWDKTAKLLWALILKTVANK